MGKQRPAHARVRTRDTRRRAHDAAMGSRWPSTARSGEWAAWFPFYGFLGAGAVRLPKSGRRGARRRELKLAASAGTGE